MAFDNRLIRIWFRRTLSQRTSSTMISRIKISKCCALALICGWTIFTMLSITSRKESCSILRLSFPVSIFDISSTSLISPRRCLLESVIFLRQSTTLGVSSIFARAIAVIPTTPFIGVRISWLMLDRNSLLALLARTASCRASFNSRICCCER